jgi:hypothetical protein
VYTRVALRSYRVDFMELAGSTALASTPAELAQHPELLRAELG